ncbi:hypothetical protein GCM10011497_06640 [Elstera cyanobacteriorum]|uniref:Uncharacterized protein n=1 Tax=Elstera cyanobacteriorum TaxID=2022747 RepID=A0A255XV31_9PROT|nr:hypothetical protein [Elstera cyanobacteriorum]OYQ20224.1 hypothetical protein CHR90_05815 [Elstera cyanobacteriorum]GFZ80806.1 hypothetical protein GCM10011497_06640 [Elstera cyanobacteriorum]
MTWTIPDWADFTPAGPGHIALLRTLHTAETDGIPNRLEPGRVEPETLHIDGRLYGNASHLDPLIWRRLVQVDRVVAIGPVVRVTAEGRAKL